MSLSIHEASAPVFRAALASMSAWLDKPEARAKEAELIEARLAPDMRPFTSQYQIASDTAKNAMARLAGIEAPAMADNEASFAELQDRCARTIAFIDSVGSDALEGAETREVVLRFPNGMGYRFQGKDYLTGFALPNFFFHATIAYALLRANGVPVGKPDFLQHLGQPSVMDPA